LIQLHCTRVRC